MTFKFVFRLFPRDIPYPEGCLPISATTGIGLDVLREQIQDVIIETTGRVKKKLKVRQGGPLLRYCFLLISQSGL